MASKDVLITSLEKAINTQRYEYLHIFAPVGFSKNNQKIKNDFKNLSSYQSNINVILKKITVKGNCD